MGCFFCQIANKKKIVSKKIRRLYQVEEEINYSKYNDSDKYLQIKFCPGYKLESDQVFYIENFRNFIDKKELIELDGSTTVNQESLGNEELGKIRLLIYENNGEEYFQRVCNNKYLNKKTWIKIGGISGGNGVELRKEPLGIQINEAPDVMYVKSEDRLYFRDFIKAHKIFEKLDELYREATNEEIENFFSIPYINLTIPDIDGISVNRRKKIALTQDRIGNFEEEKDKIISYGKKYESDILQDEKFCVNCPKELDILLDVLLERYYTGEFSNKKKKSNSSIDLN